jgi:hypothetical protein
MKLGSVMWQEEVGFYSQGVQSIEKVEVQNTEYNGDLKWREQIASLLDLLPPPATVGTFAHHFARCLVTSDGV